MLNSFNNSQATRLGFRGRNRIDYAREPPHENVIDREGIKVSHKIYIEAYKRRARGIIEASAVSEEHIGALELKRWKSIEDQRQRAAWVSRERRKRKRIWTAKIVTVGILPQPQLTTAGSSWSQRFQTIAIEPSSLVFALDLRRGNQTSPLYYIYIHYCIYFGKLFAYPNFFKFGRTLQGSRRLDLMIPSHDKY